MKKNIFFTAVYILAFLVTAVNLVYSVSGSVFSDISDLPDGKYIETVVSPDGKGEILTYKIENSIGKGIRCEYKKDQSTRNVFWQTGVDSVEVLWKDDKVVLINGVELNVVEGGFYDCRRGISLFQEGAIEGTDVNNKANTENE